MLGGSGGGQANNQNGEKDEDGNDGAQSKNEGPFLQPNG